MGKSLSILIIEDSESDMELIIRQFQKANYDITYEWVETAEQMRAALEKLSWDLIIADYTLPEFNAPSALAILHKSGLDIPFVVVSGTIGEETAVQIMKAGAHDYIMKDNMSRLVPAIERELKEATSRIQGKQAEEALRESEALFRKLFEDHAAVKLIVDPDTGNIIDANESATLFYGWSREQLKQMKIQQINTLPPEEVKKEMEKVRAKKKLHFEFRHRRADGSVRDVDVLSTVIEANKITRLHSIVYDITDRRRAEEALKASDAQYRWLSEHITDGVWLLDMNLKPTYQSPSMEKLTGFTHEELMELPMEKRVTPESLKLALELFLELMPRIMADSDYNPIHTLELEYYCKDGTILWTENKLSGIRDENGKPLSILAEVRNITERKRTEEELQQTLERLRKAFGATVQVMVSAIESRDPYTSGHQLRATTIACAIATEMGLSQNKIEGLRMAGSIHDIGKLSVPAEILSKPTKLTNIEFSLIKEHSRKGYEMLKDVESPWPLAQIVYQHHERMNGSGYPRNLKGDEILMEARILAVSDVVEAMASHRPYRPTLGLNAALEEIENNKGTLYDEAVADTCLRLFREKDYQLEGTSF